MGSYASLHINGQKLLWWKNGISLTATNLFTKADIVRGSGSEGFELYTKYIPDTYVDVFTEDDLPEETILAIIDIQTLRQRMSIFGYNQEMFTEAIDSATEEVQSFYDSETDIRMREHYFEKLDLLNRIRSNQIQFDEISYELLEEVNIYDESAIIWMALQNKDIKEDDYAIIHLDDLVHGGWLDEEFANTDSSYLIPQSSFTPEVPIIITEGVTDEKFLIKALQVIYPKLVQNVKFLESDFKPERSADSAIKLIKSFASAGISNRILVVLDNDAAANDALMNLPHPLPRNMRVVTYPEIELLNNYPTIGTQGEILMNVNGLAGSIEMYLGEDILQDKAGQLVRVQWLGYLDRIKKYQGSLIDKIGVQKQFKNKDSTDLSKWKDLQTVWDFIIEELSKVN